MKNEGKGNADEKSTARIDKGRKFPFIDFDRGTMVFEFGNLLLTRIS